MSTSGYKKKYIEELISKLHMRDRKIAELESSVSHGVYLSMCTQLIDVKHSLREAEDTIALYRKYFIDNPVQDPYPQDVNSDNG